MLQVEPLLFVHRSNTNTFNGLWKRNLMYDIHRHHKMYLDSVLKIYYLGSINKEILKLNKFVRASVFVLNGFNIFKVFNNIALFTKSMCK